MFSNSELNFTNNYRRTNRWKNGVICLFPCSLPGLWSLNCLKKCIFCNFVLTSARIKAIAIKAIYIHASERSCYALSETGIVYYAMTYCSGDIWVWSTRILLNFSWVNIFFDTLIVNISGAVAQTLINHTTLWKRVMRISN